jgi:hypothetical protein
LRGASGIFAVAGGAAGGEWLLREELAGGQEK